MSLNRFLNKDQILSILQAQYGQMWSDIDLNLLNDVTLVPKDPNVVNNQRSEIHVYSFYGDYLLGNHNSTYTFHEPLTNSLLVDVRTVFNDANINKGSYLVAINGFQEAWGNFENKKVFLKEVSPDRTELRLQVDKKVISELETFKSYVTILQNYEILNNLVINFGFNQVHKIINIRFTGNEIFLKLYQPLLDEVSEKDFGWFDFEIIDPYLDTVILLPSTPKSNLTYLRGPNFSINTNQFGTSATPFKSWDDLLDSDLTSNQRIIESSLSGSNGIRLNIDFTSFENFVFYGSAEEIVRNFHYKVSKLEEYSSSNAALFNSTASNTYFISSSIDLNVRRMDQITSNFSPFEKWAYFEPTRSIFSHDLSGSITPWPKRLVNGKYEVYPISSSLVTNWYNTLVYSASIYDQDNNNRLYWSVPEHIYADPANSDYVLFVDLVGEHFDVLYSYVKSLTKIHEKEEHPKRGVSGELLPHIAKTFGWNLQNTRQLSSLWKYKLGTNQSGQYTSTGSLFSLSEETQTHQIWRRIVNNLPFLLKTKGTSRSVKAMMSIYGIPQTLLSIKEYGGPSPKTDIPNLIENRFIYKCNFTGSNWIELHRRPIPNESGSWTGVTRAPDSIIFRFNTQYSSSISQSLWAIEDGTNRTRVLSNLELVHTRAFQTSSYSGSYTYGYLRLTQKQLSGSVYLSSSVQTPILPLFDNDSWSVNIYTREPITGTNSGSIYVDVKKASDFLYGRITYTGSMVWSGSFNVSAGWRGNPVPANPDHILLGGTTGSNSSRFVGQIDGYKEYFEVISGSVFDAHVLNPSAYHGNNETSSFYTLYRYFPLGLDQQKWDHSIYQNVSSSHPNRRASFETTASFKGFTGTESTQYRSLNETFYIQTPSLGGNLLRSQKIRLEEGVLSRDLSPTSKVEKGAFDKSGFDSNRLAIVFAPNDHVNFDIYNHTGFPELDDWIGDPEYEFKEDYSELNRFNYQYFQKYAQSNDINALIRILALYDYTFFEQVRQLVPARADLIDGILIESDVLHRSKVKLANRPTITNPQYDFGLGYNITQSAQYLTYETSASIDPDVEFEYLYFTGSIQKEFDVEMEYKYITGSFQRPYIISGSVLNFLGTSSRDQLGTVIDLPVNRYSGSQTHTQSYIDKYKQNCCYKKVIYHYSSSGTFANKYERQFYTAVSMSYNWYYSRSLECTSYQYQEGCAVENRHRFLGSKLEGAGINIDSPNTIDGGPVVSIFITNPNVLKVGDSPFGGNLIVE